MTQKAALMSFRKIFFFTLLLILTIATIVFSHRVPLVSSRVLAQTSVQVEQKAPEILVAEADKAYQQGDYIGAESLFIQATDLYCAYSGTFQGDSGFESDFPPPVVRYCRNRPVQRLPTTLLREQVVEQLRISPSESIQVYHLPLPMANAFKGLGDIHKIQYKNYDQALEYYNISASIFEYQEFLDQQRTQIRIPIDTSYQSLSSLLDSLYRLGASLFEICEYLHDDRDLNILNQAGLIISIAINKLLIFTYNHFITSFSYTSDNYSATTFLSSRDGLFTVFGGDGIAYQGPNGEVVIPESVHQNNSYIEERAVRELISRYEDMSSRSNVQLIANLPSETAEDLTGLLQQILVQKHKLGDEKSLSEAFLISDKGRTLAVDKSIAYNLSYAQRQNDLKLLRDLSLRLTSDTLEKIINEENLTLINYSIVSDEKLFIWVFKPGGKLNLQEVNCNDVLSQSVEVPSQLHSQNQCSSKLMSLIQTWSRSSYIDRGEYIAKSEIEEIERNGQDDEIFYTDEDLKTLHKLLIKPIADLLPKDPEKPIVFVPHGPLFFVPFAALMDGSCKYLIETHTIATVPNLRTLILNYENRSHSSSRQKSAIVVGNPTMPSAEFLSENGLPPLPWAGEEAIAVNNLLSSRHIRVTQLTGEQATEEAVTRLMDKASIIHLATHAIIDSSSSDTVDSQEVSGQIALAPSSTTPSEENDGWLTALDLLKMNLDKTDLVVLSACDTARGQLIPGGVVGLPFSLSLAGVRSIVASLWAVPDTEATVLLMKDFYSQILNPDRQVTLARALRQAMLDTKNFAESEEKPYSDPRYWAGFTLIGSPW